MLTFKDHDMAHEVACAVRASLVTFVLCAVAYPAAVWGVARLAFADRAAGSLIRDRDNRVIGSALIAQPFRSDKYFHPRPSAVDYRADAAGGSNLGTKNPALRKQVIERAARLGATAAAPAPIDLVTASGSGLDPHISPAAAIRQAGRVASARGVPLERVRSLLVDHIERSGAILGAPPRVNVLLLNLALDQAESRPVSLSPR
jgi:K+-transporting ATPase ATPase C chain